MYLKVGVGAEHDMAAVRAGREVAPEARLRPGANEAWDPSVALRVNARLAPESTAYDCR